MPKIFIDTNILLHFYDRNNPEKIQDFTDGLLLHRQNLLLLRQSENEFFRNRADVIIGYAKQIEGQNINIPISSFVSELEPALKIKEKLKEFKLIQKEIVKELNTYKDKDDIMSNTVKKLFINDAENSVIETSDDAILRAWKRKISGTPPKSDKKQTCGDEIIWETILEKCKDNLFIVSKDETFIKYQTMLKEEYVKFSGGFNLNVVESFSEAVRNIGLEPTQAFEAAEKDFNNRFFYTDTFGNKMPLGYDSNYGLTYINENDVSFPYCFNCNRYSAHSGMMCLECGYKSYD